MRKSDLKKSQTNENLADLAHKAEQDHEVQMARSDLYKIAKYAIKLHDMLKDRSEAEGLEGWVQAKITKSADYIGSVYHHLDYETKFDGGMPTESNTSYKDALHSKLTEKAKSKAQQKLMGQAYALKKGDMKSSDASAEVKKLAKDMKMSDLKDFASTKHKGKQEHVKEK